MPGQPKPERTDPLGKLDLGGLDDFKPTPRAAQQPKPPVEAIRAVSEAEGFPSRESAPREKAKPALAKVEQRRYRTGRNKQLSLLADEHRLVLGELLERALEAYEAAHKRK